MDEASFWRMVEDARSEAGADTERVAQALLRRLRALRPNAIERFQEIWEQAQDELYRGALVLVSLDPRGRSRSVP